MTTAGRKKEYRRAGISEAVFTLGERLCGELAERFAEIDATAEQGQLRVLAALRENRVSEACLLPTNGYGYNDLGREAIEKVYAEVFRTEAALVRPAMVSGTHAIAVALSACLRPGDLLVSPAGGPYDTLEEVIGIRPSTGSLAEMGVRYRQVELLADGSFDWTGIRDALAEQPKLVTIQRSRGYQARKTFSVEEIGSLIAFVRKHSPDTLVFVDNCYGEFVEKEEPTEVGADLAAGSLIKNPGGGLAPAGGYIVGKKELVDRAAARLTAPGIAGEVGASLGTNAAFLQGLFLAPTVVASAVKGAVFAATLYHHLGFSVAPLPGEPRSDIIQSITLESPAAMRAFCRGIQTAAPIDSFVTPEPGSMPGYEDEVIMAAGAFVQGASIELSADGPLRPPYNVYLQGGLTWPHAKFGVLASLQALSEAGLVDVEKERRR